MKNAYVCIILVQIFFTGQIALSEQKPSSTSFPKYDFKKCLESISENSVRFSGQVYPISSDAWSYVVSDSEKKETTIFLENGEVFKISPVNSEVKKIFTGPQACKNITTSDTKNSSGMQVINFVYKQALQDKKTSESSRKKIIDSCRAVTEATDLLKNPGSYMSGGQPAPSQNSR